MSYELKKIFSGIPGFDEISRGGIPQARTTLVSGTSGSGKTLFSTQFLYNGIIQYGENGVFVTFEEKPNDIIMNIHSFGWDIEKMVQQNKWAFVDASPDESLGTEIGEYDLGAFIARIEYAIKKVNAKRVAIDSISALFTSFDSVGVVRQSLYRLAASLKKLGVTCILSAERPTETGTISRYGVEEFVSDNVILLHNRINEKGQRERTIEILKFRGSGHDSEEAPLIVTDVGINLYPRPKPLLTGEGFSTKLSTGIKGLDELLHGGVYKNSTTLITGASGTGKTVSTLHFIMEGAAKKENSLLIEFEESPGQLFRNAESFGWPLREYVKQGKIQLVCHYPEDLRAEQYLKIIQNLVIKNKIKRFVMDSLSAIARIYSEEKFRSFVIGLNAFLKMNNITSVLTNTTAQLLGLTQITETHLSTATDNIIILKYVELGGSMRRLLGVLKQRGSMHEKKLMEYHITSKQGMSIIGSFEGVENLMSGSARRVEIRFDEADAEKEFMEESEMGRI